MPTIAELEAKYAAGSQDPASRMRMLSRKDRQIIESDAQRQGVAPQIADSYIVDAPNPPPTQVPQDPQAAMAAMLQRLADQPSPYAEQVKVAMAERAKSLEAFNKAIDAAATQKSEGPSQAELYFRLAAAFGAPAKGGFFENLGKAGEVAADYHKEHRATDSANRMQQLKLLLEKQNMAVKMADTDLTTVRALAQEEAKDKRAMLVKSLENYVASGKPLSEAGKLALDQGYKPGTPEFQTAVEKNYREKLEGNDVYKQLMGTIAASTLAMNQQKAADTEAERKRLTPTEVKMRAEVEDSIAANESAMTMLRRVKEINPHSFDNSAADWVHRKALEVSGSKDPILLNTREIENLLSRQAITKLRDSFGGNPTEGERKIALMLEGMDAKSVAERDIIVKNAYEELTKSLARHKSRLADIKAGVYRNTQSNAE